MRERERAATQQMEAGDRMSLKTVQDKTIPRTCATGQGRQTLRARRLAGLPRVLVFAAYAMLLPLPLLLKNYYLIRAGGSVGVYLILAAGLSIVAGQAGLLDLGYAGFYGIGAYVYALLASPKFGMHSAFIPAAAASASAAARRPGGGLPHCGCTVTTWQWLPSGSDRSCGSC